MIEKYVFVIVSIELAGNVCLALQNRRYCFYLWHHNVFYVRLTDKLTYASYELKEQDKPQLNRITKSSTVTHAWVFFTKYIFAHSRQEWFCIENNNNWKSMKNSCNHLHHLSKKVIYVLTALQPHIYIYIYTYIYIHIYIYMLNSSV
jgi:hypothetical protein